VNVLLVAEESAGIQVLRALAASPHRVVAAMTAPPTRGGGATVGGVAEQLGVPVVPSERVRDPETADWMRDEEVDLLLNVHSLYLIVGEVVAAPRIGSFNLHPGPLPEYAGLNTPSWAIYNGEPRHGVTVHWMEPGVDTGAVAYEARFDLTESDTGLSVSARCVREGVPLIERLLETAAEDPAAIPAEPQDLSRRRYYKRAEVPDDGRIVWLRPAKRIVDLVRAADYFPFASPWGTPTTQLGGVELAVLKASRTGEPAEVPPGTVGEARERGIAVAAADEWVLVERVQQSGRAQPAAEVLRPGLTLT
jgi:UDP-4-amino-4-deoxy-L-arabinose formyltransferase/UDP-glucuronic acid dehydrogenase (UDP-4-keto-hexauronic acid decarboxylating)